MSPLLTGPRARTPVERAPQHSAGWGNDRSVTDMTGLPRLHALIGKVRAYTLEVGAWGAPARLRTGAHVIALPRWRPDPGDLVGWVRGHERGGTLLSVQMKLCVDINREG